MSNFPTFTINAISSSQEGSGIQIVPTHAMNAVCGTPSNTSNETAPEEAEHS
jgi:hypothetical protein